MTIGFSHHSICSLKLFILQPSLVLLLLTGCVVGPDYTPPTHEEIPDEWHEPDTSAQLFSSERSDTNWWSLFNDPLLEEYICQAAAYNKDIQIAEANLLHARAARRYAASFYYPQLSNDINTTRQAFSKNGPLFIMPNGLNPNQSPTPTVPRFQDLFNFLFDAAWEIDLFGKTRRRVEAADARIGSSIEHLNDTMLSVFAEVARNYVEIRTAQQRLLLINQNLELIAQNVEVAEKRFYGGLDNALNVDRLLSEQALIHAKFPQILAEMYSGIYNLSVLIGHLPECLLEEMVMIKPLPEIPGNIALGIRSDLLRQRPDVRRAERELAAATAEIGVAVASFYPSFTLSGEIGFQSVNLANLFNSGSNLWSYDADLNTPLFTGWQLQANLDEKKADAQAAALEYEKTVLNALLEAERNLMAVAQDMAAVRDLQIGVARSRNVVTLTHERFTKGAISITDLLDTERQLISMEDSLLTYRSNALLHLISLYKSLGGGWITHP